MVEEKNKMEGLHNEERIGTLEKVGVRTNRGIAEQNHGMRSDNSSQGLRRVAGKHVMWPPTRKEKWKKKHDKLSRDNFVKQI